MRYTIYNLHGQQITLSHNHVDDINQVLHWWKINPRNGYQATFQCCEVAGIRANCTRGDIKWFIYILQSMLHHLTALDLDLK